MYSNPFIKKNVDYKRDYNIVKKYINDSSFFIHKMKDIPLEKATELVTATISKEGKSPLNDPVILTLERGENGDKVQKESTFLSFLKDTQDSRDLTSPSLTTYLHPDKKPSMIANFLVGNMDRRKEVKKRGFLAEMNKDLTLTSYCYNLQTAIKIINNSVSGAHGSAGTPLYNHSAHPALTSTCRCATSYANANNERFLEGMRHYWCFQVVQNDIISIIANSDYKAIKEIIETFNLSYPDEDYVIALIRRSTELYWSDEESFDKLVALVKKLSPIELAAYVYTQDCYSLFNLNPDLVRTMINDFFTCEEFEEPEADFWIEQMDDDILMTISIVAHKYLDGKTISDTKKLNPVEYKKFANSVKNFIMAREKYRKIIEGLWRTDHIPASIGKYPSAIRKTVILSDTDSTIFTVANWVERVVGKLSLNDEGKSIASIMVYFASQTLKHILATYSANMGVVSERIFQLTMKNEFMMESLMLTSKSKHYAYRSIAKEGNVFSTPVLDIKGVTLRNSKVPIAIRTELRNTINDILEDIKIGKGISISKYLKRVGDIERNILSEIQRGSGEFLIRQRIKPKDAYRLPMSQAYYYYELWQNVFAAKYGDISTLPCAAIKVSLDFKNKTKFDNWVENIADVGLAKRLRDFLTKTGRKFLTNILVPLEIATNDGIPSEILAAADVRRVIYSSTEGFYLVLESLGFYCQNDSNSRLIMDNY